MQFVTQVAPMLEQRQDSASRIQSATGAIADGQASLTLSKDHVSKLRAHVHETKGQCAESEDATEHLEKLRALIMNLEDCPGGHDFPLTLPSGDEVINNDEDHGDDNDDNHGDNNNDNTIGDNNNAESEEWSLDNNNNNDEGGNNMIINNEGGNIDGGTNSGVNELNTNAGDNIINDENAEGNNKNNSNNNNDENNNNNNNNE